MIKFHPNNATLVSFVQGILPSASSLIVSVHCDMCPSCSQRIRNFTESRAKKIFSVDITNPILSRDYISMFETITRDKTLISTNFVGNETRPIELDGRKFTVPATLTRLSNRVGEWSHLMGKLWQAPIDIGGASLAQLIFMEQGGCVPEHTHKGNEISLVLDGQFDDGNSHYDTGDYIALNQSHTHMPVSNGEEGCLVITALDKPLHFTAGWAKLINPLSHLYFKANTH